MDVRLECTRCGHVGYDVQTRIVEVPDEVMVAVGDYTVRERWRAEPRCVDREKCDDRLESAS
jgi:hypothetical protein